MFNDNKIISLTYQYSAVQNKRTVNYISIETEKKAKNFFLSKNVTFLKIPHVPKYLPRKKSPKLLTLTYFTSVSKICVNYCFFSRIYDF